MEDEDIIDLTPDELETYISTHHESLFKIIDVREPTEYRAGHLPGSIHMSLSDVDPLIQELKEETVDLLFCCSVGNRSLVAALFLAESDPKTPNIYHLTGGIHAWDGLVVPDIPRADLFPAGSPMTTLLRTAMNMEKGAFLFYGHALARAGGSQIFRETIEKLMSDEKNHARQFYGLLTDEKDPTISFQRIFKQLSGEFIEGGDTLKNILKKISAVREFREFHTLDTALILEYSAYDLYKTMASITKTPKASAIFAAVAQEEKTHIRIISETMGGIPGPIS